LGGSQLRRKIDLAIWEKFPNAAFTLFRTAEAKEEFHLGAFELRENLSLSEK